PHQRKGGSEPHPCRKAVARKIADGEHQLVLKLEGADEITRDVAHREDLAGNFKRLATQITWTAESSLHLGGFVQHAAQVVRLTAQFGHLIFQRGIGWRQFGSGGAEFYAAGRADGERPSP